MAKLAPLDGITRLPDQLDSDAASVVLVNLFTADPGDEEALIAAWSHDAEFMKRQPGYISTQLHRAVGPAATFLNYAVWESVAHFRAAFENPEFQGRIARYPDSVTVHPQLFRKLAVPGHCVA